MGNFWAIYAGFILGILTRSLLGKSRAGVMSFVVPVVLGMAGAFALDFAGQAAGFFGPDQLAAFLTGLVGAVVVLAGWRTYDRRVSTTA